MKKFGLLALMAVLLLGACNKNEDTGVPSPKTNDAPRFYGVKRSEVATPTQQGVAQYPKLWHPCTTIKVRLLSNAADYSALVRECANEWEQYCSVKFQIVESGNADVRMSFDDFTDRYVTWSYIGTDCRTVTDQSKPTANFTDFTWLQPHERKGDVLRVLGQVLGLEMEHRNLNFSAQWAPNPSKVPNYWASIITDVDWATIRQYVFDPLEATSNTVCTNQYDALSIMAWPFPSYIMSNGNHNTNYVLSATDKTFIAQLYPKSACDDGAIVTMKTSKQEVAFKLSTNSDLVVDWGDGVRENRAAPGNNGGLMHTYTNATEHTIKIYGATEALSEFYCDYNRLTMLDISRNTRLSVLMCTQNELVSVDVSKNIQLKMLYCNDNQLNRLSIASNINLSYLNCSGNPFISDQPALINLAQSLPSRAGGGYAGQIDVVNSVSASWIASICASKNWTIQ